ncbi:ATP-binding protein [Paraburkholderia sp. D15]|uniref:ATP-binding response regulator n=1 Tax=Paraburkholderia sp. D15 TaxID=2880218 RepID=UPI00247A8782|nr:ATP-binding protein [Paraburkholderia sp. D15]WGS53307.1 ATP-binding protein [Paraburkholderia sp. D15]WKF61245.1 Autoinducer 2 sensor kinase/phosphatase LuxQ [Paraburkholderia busanensis]
MRHRILSTAISSNLSLVAIRDRSRQIGELFGLDNVQRTRFITAVSEIARNAIQFAGGGTLTFLVGDATDADDSQCVVAEISDKGPGIANVEELLRESWHRQEGSGVGIPGSRRMADGFFIHSEPGKGTTVTLEMFLPRGTPRLSGRELSARVDELTRRKPQTPVEELEQQNREMMLTLEELRQKKADLEDADKRKNEFLAMLAHELRNPLAAISLSLQLAERSDADYHQQTYAVIGRQTAQLSRMVNDLLDVSRITRGKVELQTEVVTIGALIDGGVEMSLPELNRRGHQVVIERPDEPISVRVDAARLKQVFNNIIHNAARYTLQPDVIRMQVTRVGNEVQVAVIDRGVGIDSAMLPRIFDLFAQAPTAIGRQDAGLGIGLTVVQRLVRDHGGSVEAFSDGAGTGTRIVVTLPVVEEAVPEAVPEIAPVDAPGEHKVLVVDDNKDSADALAALLELHGYRCAVAYDGASALQTAASFAPTVGVIDLGLPDMPGFDVAIALRKTREASALTLVALSGYSGADYHSSASDAGFNHYFAKPLLISDFFSFLATVGK